MQNNKNESRVIKLTYLAILTLLIVITSVMGIVIFIILYSDIKDVKLGRIADVQIYKDFIFFGGWLTLILSTIFVGRKLKNV